MSYLSKKDVLSSITERRKVVKGKEYSTYEAYVGTNPINGKQVRFSRSDKGELKSAVEDFYRRLRTSGETGCTLTVQQSMDALQAIRALSEAELEISLLDCVKKLIEYKLVGPNKPKSITLGDALAEYLETFTLESENRRTVESRVGRWANAFGKERYITEVTELDVMSWIDSNYQNPKTNNNHMTYIRTFFGWCVEKNRRYLLENPLDCVKKKPVQAKRPEFMKSNDVEKLLRLLENDKVSKPELLAYAIISFFGGIRREEILRGVDDESAVIFDFEHTTIVVVKVKRFTQGAHPRSFPMSQAFIAWAKSFNFNEGLKKIDHHVVFRIRKIAEKNGIYLPKNAGRHTFITQMVAMTHDIQKTCQYAGTSPQMLKDNYNGLSFEDDALKFFGIRPLPSID